MPSGLLPNAATDAKTLSAQPQTIVEAFLAALMGKDLDTAGALLADDVQYSNVGLPSVHGKRAAIRVLAPLSRRGIDFEVYLHAISAAGPVVLTERTETGGYSIPWRRWVVERALAWISVRRRCARDYET